MDTLYIIAIIVLIICNFISIGLILMMLFLLGTSGIELNFKKSIDYLKDHVKVKAIVLQPQKACEPIVFRYSKKARKLLLGYIMVNGGSITFTKEKLSVCEKLKAIDI